MGFDEKPFGIEIESEQQGSEGLCPHFDLTFDGSTMPWIDASNWTFPCRFGWRLPDEIKVTPGRHKLQFTLRGNPGTFTDTTGREYRNFEGTMVSNELEFEVVEASEH